MGTKPTITVLYKTSKTDTAPTTLNTSTVQHVSWSIGKRLFTDDYSGGTCRIMGRDISVISALAIGYEVKVTTADPSTGGGAVFYGYIADIRKLYGIKAAYDTWELTIDSPWSRAARATGSINTTAGQSTGQIISNLTGIDTGTTITGGGNSATTISTQTLSGQISDTMNVYLRTEQGWANERYTNVTVGMSTVWTPSINFYDRNANLNGTFSGLNFADDNSTYLTVAATKYNQIEFLSAAMNYSTQVVVQATGLADQSAGTGTYVYTIPTINQTTSGAADIAGYVKTMLDINQSFPFSITFDGASVTTNAMFAADPIIMGQYCRIMFRGTEYLTSILGAEITANPSDYSITLYLVSNAQYAWLTLDSTSLGIIGTNKLGF